MAIFVNLPYRIVSKNMVATCLRCGGIFYYRFTTNLFLSLQVK